MEEIRLILEALSWKTVFEGSATKVRLQERTMGYSEEPVIGGLQAKLSLMLEVATNREEED